MNPIIIELIENAMATLRVAADDVACGLKPYEANLRASHADLKTALKLIRTEREAA